MSKHRSSHYGHSEGVFHGESTGTGFSTSHGLSDSTTLWMTSDDRSARSSMLVRHASEDFGLQIRALAKRLTVSEFIDLRAKVEDVFDSVLLSGRF